MNSRPTKRDPLYWRLWKFTVAAMALFTPLAAVEAKSKMEISQPSIGPSSDFPISAFALEKTRDSKGHAMQFVPSKKQNEMLFCLQNQAGEKNAFVAQSDSRFQPLSTILNQKGHPFAGNSDQYKSALTYGRGLFHNGKRLVQKVSYDEYCNKQTPKSSHAELRRR